MSTTHARRVLWIAAVLLVPLPYVLIADGAVPVVRVALLGMIAGAYAALVDGSGVAWIMAGLLLTHVVLYTLLLALAARLVARLLPDAIRAGAVLTIVALGSVIALVLPIYHTPFDDDSPRSSWTGLLQ